MNLSFCSALPELNWSTCERIDPLFHLLTNGHWSPGLYLQFQLAVIGLGALWMFHESRRDRFGPLFTVVALIFGLVFLLGNDPAYYTSFWLPSLLAALIRHEKRQVTLSLILSVAAGVLVVWNAGATAPFVLLLTMIFFLQRPAANSSTFAVLTGLLAGALFGLPQSWYPSFPPGARFAPVSPLNISQPAILGGISHEFNPLLFAPYQEACQLLAAHSMIILVALLIGSRVWPIRWTALAPTIFMVLLALGEGFAGDMVSLAPFQSMRRLLPGLGLVLTPWMLFLPLTILGFAATFIGSHSRRASLVALLLFCCSVIESFLLSPSFRLPQMTIIASQAELRQEEQWLPFLPSANVVNETGLWSADPKIGQSRMTAKRLANNQYVPALTTTVRQDAAPFMVDGKESTRWSTGRPQLAGDSVTFSSEVPFTIDAVGFAVGPNVTDFPRGIRLELSEDGSTFREAVVIPDWHGPLRWNAQGQPFFGPPHDVTIQLPSLVTIRSLRATLLTGDPTYDWSIAELYFYRSTSEAHGSEKIIPE